jgi:hypothetical protein
VHCYLELRDRAGILLVEATDRQWPGWYAPFVCGTQSLGVHYQLVRSFTAMDAQLLYATRPCFRVSSMAKLYITPRGLTVQGLLRRCGGLMEFGGDYVEERPPTSPQAGQPMDEVSPVIEAAAILITGLLS